MTILLRGMQPVQDPGAELEPSRKKASMSLDGSSTTIVRSVMVWVLKNIGCTNAKVREKPIDGSLRSVSGKYAALWLGRGADVSRRGFGTMGWCWWKMLVRFEVQRTIERAEIWALCMAFSKLVGLAEVYSDR